MDDSSLLTPPTIEQLQEEKLERKNKRLDDCGSWATWYDPHTGRMTGFTFHCDLWRECPTCLERRAKREKKFVEETIEKKQIVMLQLDPDDAKKLTRKLEKDEYQRFPQDGYDLIFVNRNSLRQSDLGESVELTPRLVEELDWTEIVHSPGRKNKSGALFTSTKTSTKEDNWAIVETTQFVSDAPRDIITKVASEIVAQTSEMNPTTIDEVVEYINTRAAMTMNALQARGFVCTAYRKKVKVSMSRVNWCNNLCLINEKFDNDQHENHTKH